MFIASKIFFICFSGLFVYFYYGIKHSTLEPRVDEDERIELKMKPSQTKSQNHSRQTPQPVSTTTTARIATVTTAAAPAAKTTAADSTAVVIDDKTETKRPRNLEPIPTNNDSNMFVSPSAFPKWDD